MNGFKKATLSYNDGNVGNDTDDDTDNSAPLLLLPSILSIIVDDNDDNDGKYGNDTLEFEYDDIDTLVDV
jgi:hypothetical protein